MALGLGAPCATSIGSSSLPGHRRAMALKRRAAARAPRARRRRGGFGSSKGSLAATSGATSALALEAWKGDVVVPNWLSNCLWALKVGQRAAEGRDALFCLGEASEKIFVGLLQPGGSCFEKLLDT